MSEHITDSIIYVGQNDHTLDLFEGQYDVPLGMAYNSYVILDEKTAVLDTMDAACTQPWLDSVEQALGGRKPDYLVIHHMEPDHSASLEAFLARYPETTVVGNAKIFTMIGQFFPGLAVPNRLSVKDGETLELGRHSLKFFFAPMVHWPEVMMSYDASEKIFFSADAFGKFGALDVEDPEGWACEARRYYFGIVGKYGRQVQMLLKKVSGLEIAKICPLHGPILTEDLGYYLGLYQTWSAYEPESKGICICYTSVYGHTKAAAQLLYDELLRLGAPKVALHDLARDDLHEAVEDAFRYDRLALATTTYSAGIFPAMKTFLDNLVEHDYQKRTVALIENGSWAPTAAKGMRAILEAGKDLRFLERIVTIRSAMTEENEAEIRALAEELLKL